MNQHTCQELYTRYQESVSDVLNRLQQGESLASIARYYGFERSNFANWLHKNGYRQKTKTKGLRNTPEVLKQAYEYCLEGKSIAAVSRIMNLPRDSLARDLMLQYNFKTLPDGKKVVNDSYFENIDTLEKAYWLGFFAADGYNDGKSRIEFCLKDTDKACVERFKKAVGANQKISRKVVQGFTNWRISIKSSKMSNDLTDLGYGHNKTYKKIFPESLREDLYPHFIRGYLDGDGYIHLVQDRRLSSITIVTASSDFAYSFQKFLLNNVDIICHIRNELRRSNNLIIYFSACEGRKLLDYCYKDSTPDTRLERKYDKYLKEVICRPGLRAMKKTLDD